MINGIMRRIVILIIILLGLTSASIHAQETDIFESPWRGDYFNNPYLAGEPVLTRFDQGIGFDWGRDRPADGVPRDNFSVRWGKGGNIPAGTYRFIVTANLGFRLYIDNEVILDTWEGGASGIPTGRDIFIEGGQHNIQLDYRAFDGEAYIFLDWGLAPDGGVAPQSSAIIGTNTVTVTANTLNVRSEPRITNNITARIARGQQFAQLGFSEDGRWVNIDLGNGENGWVSARFVNASTGEVSSDGLTGQTLRSTTRLLIRSAPDIDSEALGLLLREEDATITGRSENGNWWQIEGHGRAGWVSATFVILSPDVDADAIPVID